MTKNPSTVLIWVSKKMGVPADDILSESRKKHLVKARYQVAGILRNYLHMSYPEIGFFLNRNYTTIIKMLQMVEPIFYDEEILDINDDT